jgi:hypothetical protein
MARGARTPWRRAARAPTRSPRASPAGAHVSGGRHAWALSGRAHLKGGAHRHMCVATGVHMCDTRLLPLRVCVGAGEGRVARRARRRAVLKAKRDAFLEERRQARAAVKAAVRAAAAAAAAAGAQQGQEHQAAAQGGGGAAAGSSSGSGGQPYVRQCVVGTSTQRPGTLRGRGDRGRYGVWCVANGSAICQYGTHAGISSADHKHSV